jgi:nucleoside-diphosphate-sugar epimerase
MESRAITVLGGAGYVGSILCRQLLQQGFRVRCFDLFLFGPEPVRDLLAHPRFSCIAGDIRDPSALASVLDGAEAVVHLAGLVGDASCNVRPDLTASVNARASKLLAELAPRVGIERLLFCSSCSVYGGSPGPVAEDSPTDAGTPYTRTKLEAEEFFLEAKSATFHPTILRLATVFGVSPRMRFDLAVNVMVAQAQALGHITVSNGQRWRPFIHTTDAARAFLHLLLAPAEAVSGQIFNVGSGHMNCTIRDIGRLLAKHYPQLEVTEAANGDGRDYRVDFSRIEAQGFRCEVTLDEGVREISAYVRERRPDLGESRYHNGQTTKEKLQALLFDSQMGSPSPPQESVRSQRICDLE